MALFSPLLPRFLHDFLNMDAFYFSKVGPIFLFTLAHHSLYSLPSILWCNPDISVWPTSSCGGESGIDWRCGGERILQRQSGEQNRLIYWNTLLREAAGKTGRVCWAEWESQGSIYTSVDWSGQLVLVGSWLMTWISMKDRWLMAPFPWPPHSIP